MTMRKAAAAAILALVPCAAAACSVPGSPPAPPAAPLGSAPLASRPPASPVHAVANNPRACVIAPSAMVGAALGLPVGHVVGTVEGPVTVCAYTGHYEVIVRFQHGEDAGEFAGTRQATGASHQLITAVTGLGKDAYLATYSLAKPPENTLAVRHGKLAIFITSPAAPRAERKLMTHLLARE